jgi:hypothetical protein
VAFVGLVQQFIKVGPGFAGSQRGHFPPPSSKRTIFRTFCLASII